MLHLFIEDEPVMSNGLRSFSKRKAILGVLGSVPGINYFKGELWNTGFKSWNFYAFLLLKVKQINTGSFVNLLSELRGNNVISELWATNGG